MTGQVLGRRVSISAAYVAVTLSLVAAVFAWFVGGMNCDDVCSGGGWTGTGDAPQWRTMSTLGWGLFGCSAAVWCAAFAGRPVLAWPAAAGWAACGVPLAGLLAEAEGGAATLRNLLLLGAACVAAAALYAVPADVGRET